MKKQTSSKFVSVFEFEKVRGVPRQKIYRLIRERRIPQEHVRLEEKVVKRLRISLDTDI